MQAALAVVIDDLCFPWDASISAAPSTQHVGDASISDRIRTMFARMPDDRIAEPKDVASEVGISEDGLGTIRSTLSRLADDPDSGVEKVSRGQYRRRRPPPVTGQPIKAIDLPELPGNAEPVRYAPFSLKGGVEGKL